MKLHSNYTTYHSQKIVAVPEVLQVFNAVFQLKLNKTVVAKRS